MPVSYVLGRRLITCRRGCSIGASGFGGLHGDGFGAGGCVDASLSVPQPATASTATPSPHHSTQPSNPHNPTPSVHAVHDGIAAAEDTEDAVQSVHKLRRTRQFVREPGIHRNLLPLLVRASLLLFMLLLRGQFAYPCRGRRRGEHRHRGRLHPDRGGRWLAESAGIEERVRDVGSLTPPRRRSRPLRGSRRESHRSLHRQR